MKNENLFNLSMLILRIVLGAIFVAHGAQKLFGTFDGIGLEGTSKMVEGLGFGNAYSIALIWACIEFIGGIFLILGILARGSAFAIALTMLIRLWKINIMYGFFIQNGGIEYGLLIIGACIPLILMGGGSWSVWDV
jgi:putative oxidoreductase